MRTLILLILASVLVTGCGSGDSGDSVEKQCESAMTLLCDKACDCATGSQCSLRGEGGPLITFEDRAECLSLYVGMACPQADQAPAGFFTACEKSLGSAQCEVDPDEALLVPDACIME